MSAIKALGLIYNLNYLWLQVKILIWFNPNTIKMNNSLINDSWLQNINHWKCFALKIKWMHNLWFAELNVMLTCHFQSEPKWAEQYWPLSWSEQLGRKWLGTLSINCAAWVYALVTSRITTCFFRGKDFCRLLFSFLKCSRFFFLIKQHLLIVIGRSRYFTLSLKLHPQFILLRFHVIDQHKVADSCEEEQKQYIVPTTLKPWLNIPNNIHF